MILAVNPRMKNPGCRIMGVGSYLEFCRLVIICHHQEAYCNHLEASGDHLGGIWALSGWHLGTHLEAFWLWKCIFVLKFIRTIVIFLPSARNHFAQARAHRPSRSPQQANKVHGENFQDPFMDFFTTLPGPPQISVMGAIMEI